MFMETIAAKGSDKSKMIYHEDTKKLHVNNLERHNYFIPFEKSQNPFLEREESKLFDLLNGSWGFRYFDSIIDLEDDFVGIPAEKNLSVPANWQFYGYDKPQYTNVAYPIPFDPPYVPDDNPVGIYNRSYTYQKDGRDRILVFEGVDSCFYLFVNKELVGYSQVAHSTSEFDITSFLVEGENQLTVAVLKWCDGTYLEDQDKFRLSGIFRDVYVLSRPKKRITNYQLKTVLKDSYKAAELQLRVEGMNLSEDAEITVTLKDTQGETITVQNVKAGEKISIPVDAPQLWSAENPALYSLVLETQEEIIGERVGFREIKIENGVVKVNGVPVKFRGVNRHDSYPDTGYVCSREQMKKDLVLMKRHNINGIRTSHYPNSPLFYQMCDEFGFYVIDEADVEAHGCVEVYNTFKWEGENPYGGIALLASDEMFLDAIVDRAESLVMRDYNRPCVLFWSLGNESGFGTNFVAAAKRIKELDDSRLVHYESIHNLGYKDDSVLDVVSRMYASVEDMAKFLENEEEKRPFIQCEYCHAMGNGPGDLEDYHNAFWSHERFCGGFIWEWCDHGFIQGTTDEGKVKYGYGGDFGEKHNDGNFCMDALVYPDRRPHTGLYETKQVYRPIRVSRKGTSDTFVLRSLLTQIDAGNMISGYYEISYDGGLIPGKAFDFQVDPLGTCEITIPEIKDYEDRESYLRFIFKAKEDTLYWEKGYEVCFDQLTIGKGQKACCCGENPELATCSVTESALGVDLSIGSVSYHYNKRIATFDSIMKNGKELLQKPIAYNFFRAPIDNDGMRGDWFRAHLDDYTVKSYETKVEISEDNRKVTITQKQSFGWSINRPFVYMDAIYTVTAAGIDIHCQVETTNKVTMLPRFGIRLFLDKSFDTVSYYGYGPYESYVDKHQASYKGNFTAKVSELYEDYIKPQENSSHYGCQHMEITDGANTLQFLSAGMTGAVEDDFWKGFSFNASEYTQEEFAKKKHNYELEKCEYNVVCVDYKMAGVGSNSCGPALAEKYRIELPKFTGEFHIRVQ